MKTKSFLKFCAVGSSVTLAALFIGYRAGAFDFSGEPSDSSAESVIRAENVSEHVNESPLNSHEPTEAERGEVILSGSKFGTAFVAPTSSPESNNAGSPLAETKAPSKLDPTIFSGSKTLMIDSGQATKSPNSN